MTASLFDSRTARLDLPLLFAGQAQKEVFVNEALLRLDALLGCAIEGEIATPPADPEDGKAWLVGGGASGEWAGHDGKIAARQAGQWLMAEPRDGMRIFNRATGQMLFRNVGWQAPDRPAMAEGGATVDAEARAAIVALTAALTEAGIFSST